MRTGQAIGEVPGRMLWRLVACLGRIKAASTLRM